MLIHTNQPLIILSKKVSIVCRIRESALIRNFLRNERVRVKADHDDPFIIQKSTFERENTMTRN